MPPSIGSSAVGLPSTSGEGGLLTVKLASANQSGRTIKQILRKMRRCLQECTPKEQFESRFFDESIANPFESEQRTARLTGYHV